MNIIEFKNKKNHENILMISATDVQQAKSYIANHNNLVFDEWEINGMISHQLSNEIKCAPPPYAYIAYTNHEL